VHTNRNRQKQIDISIPKLDTFLHKIYIHVARKIYKKSLFELNVPSLQIQRNNRELETIIQECVLITIRDSIPTEEIIRAYLDESIEQEEEVTIENIPDEDEKPDKSAETAPTKRINPPKSPPMLKSLLKTTEKKFRLYPPLKYRQRSCGFKNPVNDYDSVINSNTNGARKRNIRM
jgi:hypothetical protein